MDQLSQIRSNKKVVYEGVVEICCQALAHFARSGVIENWSKMDFNVADLLDEIELVKSRDAYIRSLIANTAK